ncbi:MAG: hypothetical protein K8R75_01335 [Deltaproteobacteria bacterium]|nr:hypothetical protein [Deltaproteobacteria bacterium]
MGRHAARAIQCKVVADRYADWVVGTLVHVLKFGIPPLDDKGRPKMFYSRLIHDQCPRFADYERENFAAKTLFPFYQKNNVE